MLINQQPYSLRPPEHGSRIRIPFGQRNVYKFYCILLPCVDIKCLWVYFPSIWFYYIKKKFVSSKLCSSVCEKPRGPNLWKCAI